jgi:GT2 family glycosyltransferase
LISEIPRVGIVVPTLGTRQRFLIECLESIRDSQGKKSLAHVILVSPESFDPSKLLSSGLVNQVVGDPKLGLPSAINEGFKYLPREVEYVNWLGDDDLLANHSLETSARVLDEDKEVIMTFGACDYIDTDGNKVWSNKSGQWAVPLLRFGPDLIPQPGALFRRDAFEKVGQLDVSFDWAFDFDLFLRLSKAGRIKYIPETVSKFRWHPESLSVEHRSRSISEASSVRVSHLPSFLKPISFIWESPVRFATLTAGKSLSRSAVRKKV